MVRSILAAMILTGSALSLSSPFIGQIAMAGQPEVQDLATHLDTVYAKAKGQRAWKDFSWFTAKEVQALSQGELVFREDEVPGLSLPKLTIAQVLDLPVEAVYMVVADPSRSAEWTPNLSHSVPLTHGMQRTTLQFMEAPYPAQDRGWITRMHNNKSLYDATAGQYWEVWWHLEPELYDDFRSQAKEEGSAAAKKLPGDLSAKTLNNSATLGVVKGAWSLLPLGKNKTLVCYQNYSDPNANAIEATVASVIGGRLQKGIFDQLKPIAKEYASGQAKPPQSLPDMTGGSALSLWKKMMGR